jgi:hypothetical protein
MVERASDTGAGGVSTTPTPTPTPAATPVRSQDATAATPPPSALLLLEPSQQPPSRIGGFRLLNELGAGGMGRVWRARQESVGREVALKLLDPTLAREPGFTERFMREAKAMAMINHPQVVACFDAGVDQGRCFLALELVPGGDCARLAKRRGGRLVIADVVRIGIDCARGLEAIQAAGLIHRDIKPANIFLTDDPAAGGRAKLGDLGLVRPCAGEPRVTHTGAALGTPAYMAPEQARGEKHLDIRADIYALGATLFELATGEPPFAGDTAYAVVSQVLSGKLPDPRRLNPEISVAFAAILLRAMARTPDERFASPRELREDLERLAAGEMPLAFSRSLGGNLATGMLTRPGVVPASQREASSKPSPGRRHPWLVPGVLLVAMMALALLVAVNPWQGTPTGNPDANAPAPTTRERAPAAVAPAPAALAAPAGSSGDAGPSAQRTQDAGASLLAAPPKVLPDPLTEVHAPAGASSAPEESALPPPPPAVVQPNQIPSAVPASAAARHAAAGAAGLLPLPPATATGDPANSLVAPPTQTIPPAPTASTTPIAPQAPLAPGAADSGGRAAQGAPARSSSTLDSLPPPATVAAP